MDGRAVDGSSSVPGVPTSLGSVDESMDWRRSGVARPCSSDSGGKAPGIRGTLERL